MIPNKISKDQLQQAYDEWHLKHLKRSTGKPRENLSQWILQILRPISGKRILDIACGEGSFLECLQDKGLSTYGIDISPKAVEIARGLNPNSHILVADGEYLPWEDNCFDYVTCLGSLEHFPDIDKGIKEIARVLKPSGLSIVYVPNSYFIGHIYMAYRYGIPPTEGEQMFSEKFGTRLEWQNMLEKHGLCIIKTRKYNTIWTSRRVGLMARVIYNLVLKPLIPLNLSYSFAFVCCKK